MSFEGGNEAEVTFFVLPGTVVGAFGLTSHSKQRVILKLGNIQREITGSILVRELKKHFSIQ